MNGWMMVATIIIPIVASVVLTAWVTNRSNKVIIDSTGKIIEDARARGVNCIEKNINAISNEIKELGDTAIRTIAANGESIRKVHSDESLRVLHAIEAETSGLVKAIEALAKKNS